MWAVRGPVESTEPTGLTEKGSARTRVGPRPRPTTRATSRIYARDHNEAKLAGQDIILARTADQTRIAHCWAEPSPDGWSRVANVVSARHRYGLHHTARLQALHGLRRPERQSHVLARFHFRFALQTGVAVGRKLGRYAMRHALRPPRS